MTQYPPLGKSFKLLDLTFVSQSDYLKRDSLFLPEPITRFFERI